MKELFWRIVSPLLAMVGYGKKDEEPDSSEDEDDQYEHLWRDIGGEG